MHKPCRSTWLFIWFLFENTHSMFLNKVENIILAVKTFSNLCISTAYSCTVTQCPCHNKDLQTGLFQIFQSDNTWWCPQIADPYIIQDKYHIQTWCSSDSLRVLWGPMVKHWYTPLQTLGYVSSWGNEFPFLVPHLWQDE